MEREHVAVLLVTHSMEAAKAFCKRGLVLKNGQLIFDGNIDNAIAAYKKSLERDS